MAPIFSILGLAFREVVGQYSYFDYYYHYYYYITDDYHDLHIR